MNNFVCIWKPIGITPLEAVNIFKKKNSIYKNEKISYAGRLDPMAEGVLLFLIGNENKKRNKYLIMDKIYESEIILGISTDTYDGLGLIKNVNIKEIKEEEIKETLLRFKGKQKQKYPIFSSKNVKGKPLFWWARNGQIKEIEIPTHNIEIYSIDLINIRKVKSENLSKNIIKIIKKIKGDFRQIEIINNWKKFKKDYSSKNFIKIKVIIFCSSGTYIRKLADDLGLQLGMDSFALSIKRLRVGEFERKDCIKL